jgi:proton-coupled amino acid transporter
MRSKGKKQSTKTSFNSENAQPSDYLSHAEFSESDIEVAITNFHDSDSPLTLRSPQKVAKKISFADSNSSQKTQSIGIPDIQPIVFGQNSIPRRISLFKNSFQNSHSESEFSERDDYSHTTQEILAEHLVQPDGLSFEEQFGSISHNLIGGAITRDIYKWQEDNELKPLLRTRSHPELAGVDQVTTALAIREPGGFRRHFITRRNERQGRNPPNFMTKNFMDFLVLYGFYGGDITPEDDDSDLDDNDNDGDELEASVEENRPLLNHQQSRRSLTGTSESKAFFMLLKAFVGTGVLFLPKAFLNGGLIFSILTMIVLGYLTTHCMLLLVECSRSYGGKSFGELGELIYGSKFKTIILFSIAVSQMGFCAAYFIFVGQNLRDLLMLSTNCKFILPDWVFILFQILIQIPLSWVRKLKRFGISSLVADVFILLGLAYIFSFNASVIYEKGAQPITLINLQSFPLFIGTAMFSFEGIWYFNF